MLELELIQTLHDRGFEAFFVGGAVRDMLRGVKPDDTDIVTKAKPEEIEELFSGRNVKTFGKSFKVVEVDGVEIATYRKDRYEGLDDKKVIIEYANTIEEDLERRDFTINAMAFEPFTRTLIDIRNGAQDLKEKIIRFVGNPYDRIHEDPNRIIRACRMKCLIDGEFDSATKLTLQERSSYVEGYVDYERIRLETLKAMKYRKPSKFFESLNEIGALRYIFPSLTRCVDHKGGHHHAEDVFTHSMICGDSISRRFPLLRLAAYLHDVGKPEAAFVDKNDKNKLKFFGHHKVGEELVREELKLLRFSVQEIEYISKMVDIHMKNHNSPKQIRRILATCNTSGINYKDYLRLRFADRKANLKKGPHPISSIRDVIKDFQIEIDRKVPNRYSELEVNGNDIMNLGFKQGPIIGKILKFLFEKVMDEPDLNTKEKLTELVLSKEF
jgi:tRNA nucleotidyltransferase/poly(A) polymerase